MAKQTNSQIIIQYCFSNAKRKWDTASALLKSRRFADALFFCHLSLECLLKGKIVEKTGQNYPFTHDLMDLARRTNIQLTKNHKQHLAIISTFNIASRYDDYKSSFYKKVTPAFAKKYYQITQELLIWLKKN